MGYEPSEDLWEIVMPIIDLKKCNQPCLRCRYWKKECAVEICWVNLKEDKALIVCIQIMRDFLKKKRQSKEARGNGDG